MGDVVISGHLVAIILTAIVASSKNRSVFGWLIISFFLSWLAFIIVLILPRKYRWR